MKKTLSTLLVGSMLLFPVPALATDSTNSIHSLSFNNLEQEMKDHSPLILNMGDSAATASSDLNDGINNLKLARDGLVSVVTPMLSGLGKTYVSGMTANDITMPSAPLLTTINTIDPTPASVSGSDYNNLANNINLNNNKMIGYTTSQAIYTQATILLNQINDLDAQITSLNDKQGDMWKSWLQVEQGKDQAIWGAQQAYLAFYGLYEQRDNLTTNINLLQKKLSVLQLKESLGMATHTDVVTVESQIKDLNMTLDQLNKGLDGMKSQLNVMLGQDFDTALQLQDPTTISQSQLNAMDYDQDLEDALIQSFNVRLLNDENIDKQDDAKRNFTLAFHNAYQDVQDKKKSLDLEQYKLTNEKTKYDQAVLMNSLGLLANLDFEGARSLYNTQVNKVSTAQQDLLKAYTAYDWMKKGLTISAAASGSAQSTTGASGAAGTAGVAGTSGSVGGF